MMPHAISHLPDTASALEVLRLIVSALALWYCSAALARALRYYRQREHLSSQEAGDFLLIDTRLEGIATATASYLTVVSIIALFTPPPQGQSAYSIAAVLIFVLTLGLSCLITITKITNQRVRVRIYRRLEGLSIVEARELTKNERHILKSELHKYEGTIYFLTTLLMRTGMSRESVALAVAEMAEERERLMRGADPPERHG